MADGSLKFDTKIDTDGFENGTKSLKDRLNSVINSLKRAGTGTARVFSDTSSMESTSASIQALVDEIDRYTGALYYLEKQGLYFGDKEYDETYQNLSKAEQVLNQYKKELAGTNKEQKKATVSNKKLNNSLKKTARTSIPLTKSILKMSNMFKLLALRMMMRAVIRSMQEGFQNLAQYSKQANKDMSVLKTSMQTLQNSFATAFAPILTAVAPALQTLIGYLSQAITLLGQFFAVMLTGATTFTKAKDAQVDYAKSIAKTVKEANKALSPIDKLNVVSSGSDNDYSGPTPGEMFEEVTIDSSIIDFAEQAKKVLAPALESFKELAEVLKPIGEFTWNNLKNFYSKFLKPIGKWVLGEGLPGLNKALATLFEDINWQGLTDALGKLYDALAPMAVGIGSGLISFVQDLAEFLNPILSVTIDTLALALSALADMINNVDPETWKKAGYAIGVVATAIAGIKITTGLATFISGIGAAFGDLATGLTYLSLANPVMLPALFDILGLDDWLDDLYEKLPNWVKDLWEGFWQFLYDGVKQVFNFDETFKIWEQVAQKFKDAFNADTWYEIGWNIIEGIFLGIAGIIAVPIEIVKDFFTSLWNNFKSVFGINSPAEKMKPIGEYILLGIFEGFKDTFKKWWDGIVEWGKSTASRFGVQARSIWYSVQKPFLSVKSWFSKKFKEAWEAIKKIFEPAGKWFHDIWEGIKDGFSKALWKLKDLAKAPINAVISLLNKLIDAINSVSFSMPDWDWLPNSIQGQSVGFNLKRIPRLATGTVVPANYGEFLAVLGDNKREAEVVSPISKIEEAVENVLNRRGGQGGNEIHIWLEGDAKGIFKVVRVAEGEHYDQTGKAVFVH